MDNIVKVTIYVKDMWQDRDAMHEAYLGYFQEHAPATRENMPPMTLIGVSSLAMPNMKVEIDVTAIVPG